MEGIDKEHITRINSQINQTARTKQTYVEHAQLHVSGSTFGSILSRSPSRTKTMLYIIAATTLHDLQQTSRAGNQAWLVQQRAYIVFNYPKEMYELNNFQSHNLAKKILARSGEYCVNLVWSSPVHSIKQWAPYMNK